MSANPNRHEPILVADDDPGDRTLIRRAMEDSGIADPIEFVGDGQEVIDRLAGGCSASRAQLPALILLDLNMPRLDGREALKLLKTHPRWKQIPVVVLTTSSSRTDVRASYEAGANSVFTKPLEYRELVSLMDLLRVYWLTTAALPCDGR